MTSKKRTAMQASTPSAFYRVLSDLRTTPIGDYMFHGYESEHEFYRAVKRLIDRWADRVGEVVSEQHNFLLLRFHDTPGGRPDEAWLPRYLLAPAPVPDYMQEDEPDPIEQELDEAFGFD